MNFLSDSLWFQWQAHTDVLIGLSLLLGVYLIGIGPIRTRYNLAEEVSSQKIATFTTGVIVLAVAFTSPIHILSEKYLFSMHMLQHVLITLIAPPLIILGTPDWLIRPLIKPYLALRLAKVLTNPFVAFAAFNLVFALWHIPELYNASLRHDGVHAAEHILMISTAILAWWPLTSNLPELPRLAYHFQMGYLFFMSLAQIIVFGVITFATEPIYNFYIVAPRVWGISALVDQQIGAIIMKVGGGLLFLTILISVFFKWAAQEQNKDKLENEFRYAADFGSNESPKGDI